MINRNEPFFMIVVFAYGENKTKRVFHDISIDSIDSFKSIIHDYELHNSMRILYKLNIPATNEDLYSLLFQITKVISATEKGFVDYDSISRAGESPNANRGNSHTIFDKNNRLVQDVFFLR